MASRYGDRRYLYFPSGPGIACVTIRRKRFMEKLINQAEETQTLSQEEFCAAMAADEAAESSLQRQTACDANRSK